MIVYEAPVCLPFKLGLEEKIKYLGFLQFHIFFCFFITILSGILSADMIQLCSEVCEKSQEWQPNGRLRHLSPVCLMAGVMRI